MELLIVIAVIGVMANLVMLSWGSASQEATDMKDRRNAQEIASIAAMAGAAGADFVVDSDERATIQNLIDGVTPNSGIFKNREFKLPPLGDSAAVTGAMRYLTLNDKELIYHNAIATSQISGGP